MSMIWWCTILSNMVGAVSIALNAIGMTNDVFIIAIPVAAVLVLIDSIVGQE